MNHKKIMFPFLINTLHGDSICCRHLRKKITIRNVKQSKNSSFTIFGKLFFPCKNLDFNLSGECPNFGQGVTLPYLNNQNTKYENQHKLSYITNRKENFTFHITKLKRIGF